MLSALISLLPVLALMAPSVSAANHTIEVGGSAGLVFSPANITAAIGDFVEFKFYAKNHTVTQSSFAEPCTYLQNATSGLNGFKSGFVPTAADATEFKTMVIQVKVDTPLWFYCAQGNHCSAGMVGSINAVEGGPKSFAAFHAKALALAPGAAAVPSSSAAVAPTTLALPPPAATTATISLAAVPSGVTSDPSSPPAVEPAPAAEPSQSVGVGGVAVSATAGTTTSGARSSYAPMLSGAALVPALIMALLL